MLHALIVRLVDGALICCDHVKVMLRLGILSDLCVVKSIWRVY